MKCFAAARLVALIAAFALNAPVALALSTDIASSPVVTSTTNSTPVPPNIMFIVDDSGSMNWDFLPDWTNDYYCKRASGSVSTTSNDDDDYSVNSLCCRNRSGGNDACMYDTSYNSIGNSARRGDVPFTSSDFNNVYYNPGITYTPPRNADGTSQTSQTCIGSGGTVSGTNCTSGWASVKLDAYGVQEATTTTLNLVTGYPDVEWCSDSARTKCRKNSNYFYPNQVYKYFNATVGNPFYYGIVPGEYCDSDKLTTCTTASAPTGTYTFPAKIRWCSDTALTTCQAIKNITYKYPRYPTLMPSNSDSGSVTSVFTVTGNSTAASNNTPTAISITVATGPAIIPASATLSSPSSAATNTVDAATAQIITKIANGYVASAMTCSTSVTVRTCTFTVMAPASGTCPSGAITPTLTQTGSGTTMAVTATPQFTACRTPGKFTRVDIVSTLDSYPYPGLATKATERTDCVGTTCTYLEEMTNFANWFTYYRTRMQMMKSASSLAFSGIDDAFRVGYMTINNNNSGTSVAGTSGDFMNLGNFDTTQKTNWYSKLFSAKPNNGTPLRSALSTAGLLYGGSLNGVDFNGSTVTDPVLYSCQKNFTLLSTDGYWNTGNDSGCSSRGGAGCKLDRTSSIGNTDGQAARPYSDGAVFTSTSVTPMTTLVRQQAVQTSTTTTPWSRVVTTQGGACSVPAGPAGACLQDNGENSSGEARTWCMEDNSPSNGRECSVAPSSTGTPRAYTCRGRTNPSTKPGGVDLGCVTDGGGVKWCLYGNNSTSGTSICSPVLPGNPIYVCKRNGAISGTSVTTQNQSYSQIVVGPRTVVTDQSTTYNQTVVKTNGIVTSDTNGSSTTTTTPVSTSVAPTSDTGAPDGSTTWTNGTSSSACMATPTAAGTSTPVAGAPVTALSGTASVTTLSTTGLTAGTTTTTETTVGGVSDSLADVAYYYYNTDLRAAGSTNATTSVDVGTGDLDPTTGTYTNSFQRMNTYTLGLGIDGYMKFRSDYATAALGDYYDVANGTTSSTSRCTWQSAGGTCNWPAPSSDSQANIDDLWHAAVNGQGLYFSAKSPAELAGGLGKSLASISGATGAAAAATTSNPNITSGDNFLFSSDFTTGEWTSKLERLRIDPATGNIITTGNPAVPVVDWNAQTLLDSRVTASTDSRSIFTFTSDTTQTSFCASTYSSSSKLKPFCWSGSGTSYPADTSLTAAEQANFTGSAIALMPQLCATGTYSLLGEAIARNCLSATQQTDAAGKNLVNFLRGQTGYEDQSTNVATNRFYRDRTHVLGDIVSSEAVYVKTPQANYADTGFLTFKAAQALKTGMVYVAANDGMLHAFNAADGSESWAYIPTMVMPKMFNLAAMNYGNNHKFLLDGTPVVDFFYSTLDSAWKTILVGGLGAGGAGYYALDITDPATPKGLWEFTAKTSSCAGTTAAAIGQTSDCDLGYSYGNPVITKLLDGTWVVLVTSGYNNTTPGDGKGYLYVLNAESGAIINKIGTGVGSNSTISGVCATAPCPSGLGKIAAWVDNPDTNNTTKRVYGGDLFGNLWRFDLNDTIPTAGAGYDAQLLTVFKGPNSVLQPVTARPELGESNGIALVLVGTGRLLGDSDKSDVTQSGANRQSFYAVKDQLTATGWGDNFRAASPAAPVQQTLTVDASTQSRTVTGNSVALATVPGWFIDFPDAGERAYTDPTLALGTLVFTTNLPTGTACSSSGQSFIYALDFRSGAQVGTTWAGNKLGNALATRPVVVQLEGGAVRSITRLADTSTNVADVPIPPGGVGLRRVSWRQLLED